MTRRLDQFLTFLLGPRCPHGCGERVYSKDRPAHFAIEHCGDAVLIPKDAPEARP